MARVAILATDGFEESELREPLKALKEAGHQVEIISPESGSITSWAETDWGSDFDVDRTLDEASAGDYDLLVLPGGQINPDKLRLEDKAIAFIRDMAQAEKPIAAICHGPWTLIDAGVAEGRRMTSWPSLRIDLENAGAEWVDEELVVDGNIISSRMPDDLPAFNKAILAQLDGR